MRRTDLSCWTSADMKGDIKCDWSAENREWQDRPEYFPQKADLICCLDQARRLNGCFSVTILSDLITLYLAQSLRWTTCFGDNAAMEKVIFRSIYLAPTAKSEKAVKVRPLFVHLLFCRHTSAAFPDSELKFWVVVVEANLQVAYG